MTSGVRNIVRAFKSPKTRLPLASRIRNGTHGDDFVLRPLRYRTLPRERTNTSYVNSRAVGKGGTTCRRSTRVLAVGRDEPLFLSCAPAHMLARRRIVSHITRRFCPAVVLSLLARPSFTLSSLSHFGRRILIWVSPVPTWQSHLGRAREAWLPPCCTRPSLAARSPSPCSGAKSGTATHNLRDCPHSSGQVVVREKVSPVEIVQ
ncbi:hypothetical protein C8Q78DRAFT_190369 [Trametes maxima]|nr:hypothetical protein C8Q78DRAFT_190369 [Trametes maxima]